MFTEFTECTVMKLSEIRVGLRVMVPLEKVQERAPWMERYGKVIEVENFMGLTPVLVLLDGDMGAVISVNPEDLDYE